VVSILSTCLSLVVSPWFLISRDSKTESITVKQLIGAGIGYFRIKAWDGIDRKTVSEIRSLTIQ